MCDELLPELVQLFRDPNRGVVFTFRETFPTPHAIAAASLADLRELLSRSFPPEAQLVTLQKLAAEAIGVINVDGRQGLLMQPSFSDEWVVP